MGDGNAEFSRAAPLSIESAPQLTGVADGNFLVQHSVAVAKPFVLVAINYRLGYFGFLTSQELRDEAAALGETAWHNQGLYDQRLALKWVSAPHPLPPYMNKLIVRFGNTSATLGAMGSMLPSRENLQVGGQFSPT